MESLRKQIWSQLDNLVDCQTSSQLGDQAGDQLWDQYELQVWEVVVQQIKHRVWLRLNEVYSE